jgi:peptide/nickel transport system ATP-binding protein
MVENRSLLLEVEDLRTHFFLDEGTVHAVNGVSLQMHRGETLGVVGESGCGKSVTARSIMRMVRPPGRIVSGRIMLHSWSGALGESIDLTALDPKGPRMRSIRGLDMTMVFQEPISSLSPVHTVGNQIIEAIRLHRDVSKEEAYERAVEMLGNVELPEPSRVMRQYPHELSGGMCQRVMIAMALSSYPELLIADEPTTALDVTTEARILSLMRNLQQEFGMAIMFITHDLGVIAQMADRVVVMYLGQVVEEAGVDALFHNPLHPYTRALLRSIPRLGQTVKGERLTSIRGMVPSAYSVPSGCPFHPRCDAVQPGVCDLREPRWLEPEIGHRVRCSLYD